MNKIKTLSAIILFSLSFFVSSCTSDDNFDDISKDTELNIQSSSNNNEQGKDDDDPTVG